MSGTNLGKNLRDLGKNLKQAGVSVPKKEERPVPSTKKEISPANETTSASPTEVSEESAVKTPEEMNTLRETFQKKRFSVSESLDRMKNLIKKNQTYSIKKMKGEAMEEPIVILADLWRAKKDNVDELERYRSWKKNPHEAELPPSEFDSMIAGIEKKIADADRGIEDLKNEVEREKLCTFDELKEAALPRMRLRSNAWNAVDIFISDNRPSDTQTLRAHMENVIVRLSAQDMKVIVPCVPGKPESIFWKGKSGEQHFALNPHFIQEETQDETLADIVKVVRSTAEYIMSKEKAESDKREQSARNSGFYNPNALTEVAGKGDAYAVSMIGNKIPHYRREKCTVAIPAYEMPGNLIADVVPTRERDTVIMFVRSADTVELAELVFREKGAWREKGIPLKSKGGVLDVRNVFLKNSITAFMNAVDESSMKSKARRDFVSRVQNQITERELKGGVVGAYPFMVYGWKHSKTGERHDPSGIFFADGKTVTLELCFRDDYDDWGLYFMPEPGIAFSVSDFSTDPKSRLWNAFFSLNQSFETRAIAKKLSDTHQASSIIDVLKKSHGVFVAFGKTNVGVVGYAISVATIEGKTTHTIIDAFNEKSQRMTPKALGGMQFGKERSVGMLSEVYKRFLRESYMKIAKCNENQVHGSIKKNVPTHTESAPVTDVPTEVMEQGSGAAEEMVAPETEALLVEEPGFQTPQAEEMPVVAEPVLLSSFSDVFSKGELGKLGQENIVTLAELKAAPEDRLTSIKGIGPKTLEKIQSFLSKQ